jgi:hypothetical protein
LRTILLDRTGSYVGSPVVTVAARPRFHAAGNIIAA